MVADFFTAGLLGGHVDRRSLDPSAAFAQVLGVVHPGEAEVENLHLARGGDHDVLGLEVPVHQVQGLAVVRGRREGLVQGVGQLAEELDGGLGEDLFARLAALVQQGAQRDAVHVLHDDGVLGLQVLEDPDDAAMLHLVQELELLDEEVPVVARGVLVELFDGDEPALPGRQASTRDLAYGSVDGAEVAAAELSDELVVADGARHEECRVYHRLSNDAGCRLLTPPVVILDDPPVQTGLGGC